MNISEVKIDGVVSSEGLTEDQVWDAFIAFVESKGWSFGGTIAQLDENGEEVKG